jgi:serine protease Do
MFTRLSICALLLALIVLPACGSSNKSTATTSGKGSTAVSTSAATTAAASPTVAVATPAADLSWEQIIDLLTPSTVMIRTDVPPSAVSNEMLTSGTGIVLTADGYILTNAHVVTGASALSVYTSGSSKERSARIVGISPCDDLAIIKVDDTTGLKPATLGKSSDQHVGEDVAAIGYPLNFDIGTDISISRGIISKLDQTLQPYESLIQTDAAVNHGNSGGPLVNTKGQVIGVNTLSFGETAPGINYAISIDQAQQVVPDLQAGHNRLYLGMNLGPNNYSDYFGTDQGLVVEAVASDSPASVAGVQQAFLLTQLAGLPVNNMADVCKILRSHQDGDALKVQFLNITSTEQQLLAGEVVIGKNTSTTKVAVVDRQPIGGAETPTSSSGSSGSTGGSGNVKQFSWDFSSDDGDWPTGNGENVTASISGGQYSFTVQPNIYAIYSPQSVPNATDQSIQSDVNLQAGYAGLAVRFSSDSDNNWTYYDCFIYTDGTYACGVSIKGQWSSKVDPTPSQLIKKGDVNTIQLTVVGSKVTFTINGTDVTSFDDTQITSGYIGIEAGSPKDSNGTMSFSNIGAAVVPQ